jgi:hypothetical protein
VNEIEQKTEFIGFKPAQVVFVCVDALGIRPLILPLT